VKFPVWIISFFAVTILLSACSTAGAESAEGLSIRDPWARPGPAGGTSAIYFSIENDSEADTLLGASASVAGAVELHRSMMSDDGTMSMEHQHSISIPQGETVNFEPGGLHVMLIDLTDGLDVGESFPLTLTFEKAGDVTVMVPVREP